MAGQIIGRNNSAGSATAISASSPKLLYGTTQELVLNTGQKAVEVGVAWAGNASLPAGVPNFEIGLYDVSGGNYDTAPLLFATNMTFNNADHATPAHFITKAIDVDLSAHAGKTVCVAMGLPTTGNGFQINVATVTGASRKSGTVNSSTLPPTLAGSAGAVSANQAWGVYVKTEDVGASIAFSGINGGSNTVVTGSTGNTALTLGITAATGMTIGGRAVTAFAGSNNSYTFTFPDWVDNIQYITGAQTAIITDGTNSPSLSVVVNDPAGWNSVTLSGTLNTSNTGVLNGFSPVAAVGDKIFYRPVPSSGKTTEVDAQGNIITSFTGTQTMWHVQTSTGVMRSYSVITGGNKPDTFTFTAATDATLNTSYTSNSVTITGITSAAAISIVGGEYSINGGAFTTTSGTVVNNDTVRVRKTSAATNSNTVTATLTVGGVVGVYTITTVALANDSTPDIFVIPAILDATKSTVTTSSAVTISGLTTTSPISISGGSYSVNGGAFTTSAGTITNGQSVRVQVTASATDGVSVNAVLTIGGVSATFTVTVASATVVSNFTTISSLPSSPISTTPSQSITYNQIKRKT